MRSRFTSSRFTSRLVWTHLVTDPARQYQVTLRGPFGQKQINVAHDQAILDAALRAGLELPNSCCQGWCLTCACRLLSGHVEHPHARRYYPEDAAAGFILICTAEPRSDCVLLTHQKEEIKAFRAAKGLPAPGG